MSWEFEVDNSPEAMGGSNAAFARSEHDRYAGRGGRWPRKSGGLSPFAYHANVIDTAREMGYTQKQLYKALAAYWASIAEEKNQWPDYYEDEDLDWKQAAVRSGR